MLLFLLHSLFTFVVYVSVSVTFSLFLYRFFCSHSSILLFIFCSVSLSLSLSSIFPSFSKARVLDQTNIYVLVDASVQRFRDLLEVNCSLTQPEPWIHIQRHTCAHRIGVHVVNCAGSCCRKRCQMYWIPSTSTRAFMLLLPLVVLLNISERLSECLMCLSYLLHSLPMPIAFCHTNHGCYLSSLRWECIVLLLSFCYPWHCCGAVSHPATLHWYSWTAWTKNHVIFYFLNFEITVRMLYIKESISQVKTYI